MKAIEKVNIAKSIMEETIEDQIISLSINFDYKRIHIALKDGVDIYIAYNNYNEYSYTILFSKLELDRFRFDNYDSTWEAKTKPHHPHPRYKKQAI